MRDQFREDGIRLLDLGVPAAPLSKRSQRSVVNQMLWAKARVQKLASLIRENQVDVLDVHLSPVNPVGALAAMRARIPFAVTLYQVNQMQSTKLWISGQFNLGAASQLITDSDAQAECVRGWLIRTPPICVIPNGTAPPKPSVLRERMLGFFRIAERERLTIIGQISSLVPYKGHLVLIEAARKVLDKHPNCVFLLVGYERGEEGYRELLHQRVAELGISDCVRIEGYPGPIGDVWNLIDIHVHASLLDSLPNALLEAMSLGKPSVVTAVGGIPQVIQHASNGLLVPPGNSEQLAQCLLMLLSDSQLREAISSAARSCYSQKFGVDQMTKRIEGVFSRLVIGHVDSGNSKPLIPNILSRSDLAGKNSKFR